MKRVVLLIVCTFAALQGRCIVNYTFSDTVPTGQTLYFTVLPNGSVQVVAPTRYVGDYGTFSNWDYYDKPTGILIIPDSITHNDTSYAIISLEAGAFEYCDSLISISIPNAVTTIPYMAFYQCTSLVSIQMGNAIDTIGSNAFRWCVNLNEVSIPSSVVYIGSYAFEYCTSLNTVWLHPTEPPELGTRPFNNNASGRVFILTNCSYEAYYNSQSWYPILEQLIALEVNVSSNHGTASIIPIRGHDVRCDSTVVIQTQCDSVLYHFDHWSNGNTSNPDTLHLVGDTSVTAYYISLTLNTNIDTVDFPHLYQPISGHYRIGDHIEVIYANAPYGYHFDHWSNGHTANPDTIYLQGDSTITACFERNQYSISVTVNDATMGSVEVLNGDTTALYGDTIIIVAYPNEHYHVDRWDYLLSTIGGDSVFHPFQYGHDTLLRVLTNDLTILCRFVLDTHIVSVAAYDDNRGTVTGGGEFEYGSPCIVQAYPYSDYTFDHWSNGVTDNPYAFPVTEDVELQAIFLAPDEVSYTVTVVCNNPAMGSATVNGLSSVTVMNGEEVALAATPNQGYRFLHWQDNDTNRERTVMVISDSIFTAYFETVGGTEGIECIGDENIRIYSADGHIVVEGTTDEVRVFDIVGCRVRNKALPVGVYMVKVGNHATRKVVVIR